MEASAFHHPGLTRRGLSTPLLKLRSDEQLIALFRDGSEEAFAAIHDRYRQRLFAYVRQMLSGASRADAEDVLQDVFVRAYGALRADSREVNVKAWLYRVAHNRCIDHLRRPTPPANEIFELSRTPLQDPIETAQRREDLRRLVEDVGRLPDQQRSALLMREIDGLAYCDIAAALDVTVPAVKSLLVRARVGLVEAIQARDTDCEVIRGDLIEAYDRGVKASGRSKRHIRECQGCREYKLALRSMQRSFAALSPVAAVGPIALALKALGLGGSGGGGAALGGAAAGVSAGKVCAVVCAAAVATGGAVEVHHLTTEKDPKPTRQQLAPAKRHSTAAAAKAPAAPPAAQTQTETAPVTPIVTEPVVAPEIPVEVAPAPNAQVVTPPSETETGSAPQHGNGDGTSAPAEQPTTSAPPETSAPTTTGEAPTATTGHAPTPTPTASPTAGSSSDAPVTAP